MGVRICGVVWWEGLKEDGSDFGILERWFPLAFKGDCQGNGMLESMEELGWDTVPWF